MQHSHVLDTNRAWQPIPSSVTVYQFGGNNVTDLEEISWHNRDPVLSIDIQAGVCKTPKGETFWRLATGGADSHVLIWHLTTNENGAAAVKCVADLERHQKAVNVVRFSPSKEILASGDDESAIVLWKQKEDCEFFVSFEDNDNKEQWTSWKVLRGHIEDVYDISWAPDSNSLASSSVDNSVILWDIDKGRPNGILSDYKGFVQGVSWDPCNQYLCTISTDRVCRLADISTKKTVQRVHKSKIPTPSGHPLADKTVRLFYDDTFKSFFRRLTFSLDGTLIIVPSGIIEPRETTEKISNATIVFSRKNLKEPIMILPSLDECTIAVRCSPIYFELRKDGPTPIVPLPYRIIFAVVTESSILIYDTQQISPIAVISNIHYTRLTDVAWSSDSKILIVSSTDGYCSIIHFHENELGQEYKTADGTPKRILSNSDNKHFVEIYSHKQNLPVQETLQMLDVDNNAMDVDISKHDAINVNQEAQIRKSKLNEEKDEKKLSNINDEEVGKLNDAEIIEETEDIKLVYHEESNSDNTKPSTKKTDVSVIISNKTPRRVKLITLSSPKGLKK
ncbi:hypothetical protein KM043_013324 [Ampulex compressa]|nr:hypothetical protein KM043_013324 [Ampulex compressa]